MAGPMWLLMAASLSALGLAAQLDLDCAKPESARALIDYAQLSEIEQVEDIHRDELDKALARCPVGPGARAVPGRAAARRGGRLESEGCGDKGAVSEDEGRLRRALPRFASSRSRSVWPSALEGRVLSLR